MIRGLVSATLAALFVASAATHTRAEEAYAGDVAPGGSHHGYVPIQQPGYVRLSAPLNPVPQPNIPYQVGGSVITNQAFYAHEMLYPHSYRALYGPYYYKVGNVTTFNGRGFVQREKWELQGTEVKVKYHSAISPFALFFPPGPGGRH
jgi:hypothetical protein